MPRFNVTMPQDLWDRIGEVAPEGNRSWLIRRALEAALGNRGGPSAAFGGDEADDPFGRAPASPRAPETVPAVPGEPRRETVEKLRAQVASVAQVESRRLRCGATDCEFTAGSAAARCPVHGRRVG